MVLCVISFEFTEWPSVFSWLWKTDDCYHHDETPHPTMTMTLAAPHDKAYYSWWFLTRANRVNWATKWDSPAHRNDCNTSHVRKNLLQQEGNRKTMRKPPYILYRYPTLLYKPNSTMHTPTHTHPTYQTLPYILNPNLHINPTQHSKYLTGCFKKNVRMFGIRLSSFLGV